MATQLPLNVGLRADTTFENFYFKNPAPFIKALQRAPYTYLWGSEGVGKTHLLQAACRLENPAFFFSFKDHSALLPDMLEGLEFQSLVCFDDIQAIAGEKKWEEAIFHFYNRLSTQNNRLIIAGNQPPKALHIKLPDLASRLAAGIVFQIEPLSDKEKLKALQLHARTRGLILPDEVGHYLLNHCRRHMTTLIDLLDKLDKASLAAKRKLTIPFVRMVL